jgi:hypothetical protein
MEADRSEFDAERVRQEIADSRGVRWNRALSPD